MTYTEASIKKAKQEIEAGKSFMSVANRVNEQPSEGGLRLGLSRSAVGKKRYENDFFAAKPNVLVGPRKEILYYIFEVTRIVPATQHTLAQVEPTVRRQLIAGSEHQRFTNIVEAFERKWSARTHCRRGYVAQECGQYVRT